MSALWAQPKSDIRIDGLRFVAGGETFFVKGIHYGPWRPGTGPNKGYPYPPLDGIDQDFTLIRNAHANTILIYDAPAEVLDLADRHGLKVLYCFALDWSALGGPSQAEIRSRVVSQVNALRGKPALLGWLLGNEVPDYVVQQRGDGPVVDGLRDLYAAVKRADPTHPISHANWPITKHLDLAFLDFVSFNVYPLWPPEVAANGFGPYISRVLRPLAKDKPLLISEFGVNSVEASQEGQARIIRESWNGLVAAGAAGGVVFEFADEWWKNYNNPIRPGNWWIREDAPDDELQHDEDPEESYGIVDSKRNPKPAYAAVADMFAQSDALGRARRLALITITGLVLSATSMWIWALRRRSNRRAV